MDLTGRGVAQRGARSGTHPPSAHTFLKVLGGIVLLGIAFTLYNSLRAPSDSVSAETLAAIEARVEQRLRMEFSAELQTVVQQQAAGHEWKAAIPVKALHAGKQKRILVTGGAGFVGSNLVDVLMMQGHVVYVLDNLFTGRRKNIEHWIGHPHFSFFQQDVTEPFYIEVDEIYHLACPASPPHYQYNPIKTIKTSTEGTLNMLGLAKRTKARLLFTSTSEVYGDPEQHPQRETYWGNVNPIGPRACYDEGKRVAETMCYSYAREGYVDVRVARIFNTFGPRMHPDDGRVVSNFIIQALQNQPLTVYGDGSQTRSFQYVSDLVDGLIRLMASDYNQPVNIGNPREFSIKQFAQFIQKIVGSRANIKHLPATQDDPKKRRPDIAVAKRELGWQPRVSVEKGLMHTIKYFKQELLMVDAKEHVKVWLSTNQG